MACFPLTNQKTPLGVLYIDQLGEEPHSEAHLRKGLETVGHLISLKLALENSIS